MKPFKRFRPYTIEHISKKMDSTKNPELFHRWIVNHLNRKRVYEGDSGAVQALIFNSISWARSKNIGGSK